MTASRMSLAGVITGVKSKPVRITLYGVDGIGKTTFASQATNPIFIAAEDGLGSLDVARFPTPSSWAEIFEAIKVLYSEEHDFKTLVLDSADWAESMCLAAVAAAEGVAYIDQIGYGKGYKMARDKYAELLRGLDALWMKGMNIIVIAHSTIKRYDDPENEPYDRYQIKLEEANASRLREWSDMVLFANYDTTVSKLDPKGLDKTVRAKSFGKRLLFSQRTAAYDAKTRYTIPDRLPLDWKQFWSAVQANTTPTVSPTAEPVSAQL